MSDEEVRTYERKASQGDLAAKEALVASMLKRQEGQLLVWRADPNEAALGHGEVPVALVIGRQSHAPPGTASSAWVASALPVLNPQDLVSEIAALRRDVVLVDLARRSAVKIGGKAFAVAVGPRSPGRPEPAEWDEDGSTVPPELVDALGIGADLGYARIRPRPRMLQAIPPARPPVPFDPHVAAITALGATTAARREGSSDYAEARQAPAGQAPTRQADALTALAALGEAASGAAGRSGELSDELVGALPDALVSRMAEAVRGVPQGASKEDVQRHVISSLGLDPDSAEDFFSLMGDSPIVDELGERFAVAIADKAKAAGVVLPDAILQGAERAKARLAERRRAKADESPEPKAAARPKSSRAKPTGAKRTKNKKR